MDYIYCETIIAFDFENNILRKYGEDTIIK